MRRRSEIAGRPFSLFHCPGESDHNFPAINELAASSYAASSAPTLAKAHFDRDADEIGVVLGADLLLEQRRGVRNGLVGDTERRSDLDDLVAPPQQPQDLQLARADLARRICLDRSPREGNRFGQMW